MRSATRSETKERSVSATSGGCSGRAARAAAGAPQWPQNLVPGGFSPAQDSQRQARGVPHWPQKRISSEFAAPQAAQSQAGIDLFSPHGSRRVHAKPQRLKLEEDLEA